MIRRPTDAEVRRAVRETKIEWLIRHPVPMRNKIAGWFRLVGVIVWQYGIAISLAGSFGYLIATLKPHPGCDLLNWHRETQLCN